MQERNAGGKKDNGERPLKTAEGLSVVLQQGFAEPLRVEGRPAGSVGLCRANRMG